MRCPIIVVLLVLTTVASSHAQPVVPSPVLDETPRRMTAYEDMDMVADELPIKASLSMSLTFNHANFMRGEDNERWGLSAPDYGWSALDVGASLGYWFTRKIQGDASLTIRKQLTYDSMTSASSTSLHRAEMGDLQLSTRGYIGRLPGLKIRGGWGLGISLPTSNGSRVAGINLRASPSFSLSRTLGPIDVGLSASYIWQYLETPTGVVDCNRNPDTCRIFGELLELPLYRHYFGGGLSLSHTVRSRLSLSASYSLSRSIGAVAYEPDERASRFAQVGDQISGVGQSFSFTAGWDLLDGLRVTARIATSGRLLSLDNRRLVLPFFDLETESHARTRYTISMSQAF